MTRLNVYIITDGKNGKNVTRLTSLFRDGLYNVVETVVPPLQKSSKVADVDAVYEIYEVQWCLEESRKSHPNRPVLVMRDSCITHMGIEKLRELIIDIMNDDNNYDIFYLSRWNDHCQKHIDFKTYADNVDVARTYAANGTQAIYFSVKGRDIFAGHEVMKNDRYLHFSTSPRSDMNKKITKQLNVGNIVAYCTLHNIFQFDITRATSNLDFNKISPCTVMLKNKKGNNQGTNLGYLWFIIIVILIVILAFAIARIGK